MKQPKKRKCKALLELLGGDNGEEPPASLKEARERVEEQSEPSDQEKTLQRCDESGKVCFTSEHQARRAAFRRLCKGANTGRLRAYRCPSCNQWHLSSSFR